MSKMGRYKSYLTGVQNEVGGVEATFGQCPKERRFFFMASLNQWMNDKAVYRTAPATPGLLMIQWEMHI